MLPEACTSNLHNGSRGCGRTVGLCLGEVLGLLKAKAAPRGPCYRSGLSLGSAGSPVRQRGWIYGHHGQLHLPSHLHSSHLQRGCPAPHCTGKAWCLTAELLQHFSSMDIFLWTHLCPAGLGEGRVDPSCPRIVSLSPLRVGFIKRHSAASLLSQSLLLHLD